MIIEPGLIRIFRYFTGVALIYFAGLFIYGGIESIFGYSNEANLTLTFFNLLTYLTLFLYLSIRWFRQYLKGFYLPLAIALAIFFPIFSNLFFLVNPSTTDFNQIVSRNWMLFPGLLIPLLITAWQFPYKYSVILISVIAVVQLTVLLFFTNEINFITIPILGTPIIQGLSFGISTLVFNNVVKVQKDQQRMLMESNIALSEHAETLEKLTLIRERNRLARDLHDTLAHTMSGLSVNLEAIKLMLKPGQDEISEMIDVALKNTRQGLEETRNALKDLRSKTITDLGLRLSLIEIADNARIRGDFDLEVNLHENLPDFESYQKQAIFRIMQETFHNILLHTNASRVRFWTKQENHCFSFLVSDNGEGFSPNQVDPSNSFGITGMRERAVLSNGIFTIKSEIGRGTLVSIMYEVSDD